MSNQRVLTGNVTQSTPFNQSIKDKAEGLWVRRKLLFELRLGHTLLSSVHVMKLGDRIQNTRRYVIKACRADS